MDTSSALPAAAAAHLGGMARVPDSTLPIDVSPGNPADFAALLAAQPAAARAQSGASPARGMTGGDGGRGGNLPDSGKRLPSGAAAGRSRPDAGAEPPAGAAAAAARREAGKAAAADDAAAEAAAVAADDAGDDDDAAGAEDARADRATRAGRARQESSADLVASVSPAAVGPTATPDALATTALAAATAEGAADAADAGPAGGPCSADDAGAKPFAAATAALRSDGDMDVAVDTPLHRMIAAAREGGATGRLDRGMASSSLASGTTVDAATAATEAQANGNAAARAAVAGVQAATTGMPVAGTAAAVQPDEAGTLRGGHAGKPAAGGAVRLDAPPIAGAGTGPAPGAGSTTADSGGDAGARSGHRESPPAALPLAARAAESPGNGSAPPTALPATPPTGLSALAANAAMAAVRHAAVGGAAAARAGAVVEGTPAAVAGLAGTSTDLFTGGASTATPGHGTALPPGLLAGLAPPPGSAVNAQRAAVEVQAPPGSPAFADELAGRVAVLVQQDAGGATLKLNPGHLGPVEVRVQVRDGEATVMFAAHHATTREALEGAAPRLRELLAQQGYTQVNVDVAAQGQDLAQRQAAWNQARADGGAGRDGRGPWREAPGGSTEAGGVDALRQRAAGARAAGRLDAFA